MRGGEFLDKMEYLEDDLIMAAEIGGGAPESVGDMPESRLESAPESVGDMPESRLESAPDRNESTPARGKWFKWAAAAACLCAVAAAAVVMLITARRNGGAGGEIPTKEQESYNAAEGTKPESNPPSEMTSDVYFSLEKLLAARADYETHDYKGVGAHGCTLVPHPDAENIVYGTQTAVDKTGTYAYHSGWGCLDIMRLDGQNTANIGTLDGNVNQVFVCGDKLITVSARPTGSVAGMGENTRVGIYDISNPSKPVLSDEFEQGGLIVTGWLAGKKIYLITCGGECACGWKEEDGTDKYKPAFAHNGEAAEWSDDSIAVLGEPTSVQYCACSVIDIEERRMVSKKALYGNINVIHYGAGWIAAVTAGQTESYMENPVLYTFDENLAYTGKISSALIMDAPDRNGLDDYIPKDGRYADIISVSKSGGVYRIIGNYYDRKGDESYSAAVAAAADPSSGEFCISTVPSDGISYSEILWEKDSVIACASVKTGAKDEPYGTCFLTAEFDGLNVAFYTNELRADCVDNRVGVYYGNRFGIFDTFIPLGGGIYARYTNVKENRFPGGFDLFDFSDVTAPKLLYRAENSLSGKDVFDVVNYVYDGSTFGTVKVILGENGVPENVGLSWCVYNVDGGDMQPKLINEIKLDIETEGFFIADSIYLTVFEAGDFLYYVTKDMNAAKPLTKSGAYDAR